MNPPIAYFNKLVQQIIPENGNFGFVPFLSSFIYQNVQIFCAVLMHCWHGNFGTPAEYYLGLIVLLSTNQNWVILLSVL